MSDPNDRPPVMPGSPDEHELEPFEAERFDALHHALRQSTTYGRVVSGLLVMLAVAVARVQIRVGHPIGHLGVLAIASVVASSVLFALTFSFERSGRSAAAIAKTAGSDVSYLIDAMRGLHRVFVTLFAAFLAVAALALVVAAMHFAHLHP